jgi:tRNA1Val (adenine37-N6)-methyltransferase
MESYLAMTKLKVVRRCDVYPLPERAVKRVMVELSFDGAQSATTESLVIENGARGDFSDQYRALTADFYLKF